MAAPRFHFPHIASPLDVFQQIFISLRLNSSCLAPLNSFKSLTFRFSLIGSRTLPLYPPSKAWVSLLIAPLYTFSNHTSNLTRSSYFHLKRLRAISVNPGGFEVSRRPPDFGLGSCG